MRIAEIFHSIQGEGTLLGTPSVFIRTAGCNLRCRWCDTPYTSWRPEGRELGIGEILEAVRRHSAAHAVVTGGEPLLAREIEELTRRLKAAKYHITIETAATIFKPVVCDLLSMSPKLSNSTPWKREKGRFGRKHEAERLNLPVIQRYLNHYDCQLKFVVERKEDLGEIRNLLERLKGAEPSRVLLMAQGRTRSELERKAPWIGELCKAHGFRYTPRLQIELYGNRRGT